MKGGEDMKKFIKNITALFFLLAIVFAVGVSKSDAARFGHKSGDTLKLISSLGLDANEQAALKSALSTYRPAVKTAWQNLHAQKKQLNMDLDATTPDGSKLGADAAAVANAKAQLKVARSQLNTALLAALIPAHLQQIQAQFTAQFQSRLDAKTGRLLSEYARHLEKQ
jgi:hypothetical protein